jgi:hypothetical protein
MLLCRADVPHGQVAAAIEAGDAEAAARTTHSCETREIVSPGR